MEAVEAKLEVAEAAVLAEPLPAAAVVDSILVDTVMAKLVDFSKWMPMVSWFLEQFRTGRQMITHIQGVLLISTQFRFLIFLIFLSKKYM